MSLHHTVIIGAGQAGIQAADSLRAEGYRGRLTMLSDETVLPYQRPQLSKDFLDARAASEMPEALPLRAESFFTDNHIDLRRGTAALSIEPDRRRIHLATGGYLDYTDLIIATGTRARQLPVPGTHLAGVHTLRTIEDSHALREDLMNARTMVVVGAGFIGLEIAAVARGRGIDVTVLAGAAPPMARAVSPVMSDWFAGCHRDNGVDLCDAESAVEFQGSGGRVRRVISDKGRRYDADVVVVGIGAVANVEMLSDTGIDVHNGVIVDEFLRTSCPGVWALGDCATLPTGPGGARTRIESVQNATDQGRLLARNLIASHSGAPLTAYGALPWFWSHQGAFKLQIAGVSGPDSTDNLVLGNPASGKFSVLRFTSDGKLAAVESVNSPGEHMAARKLLTQPVPVTVAEASVPGFCLKQHSRRVLVPA
ncbi:pyridine nucleotide-disulfide oxidoreductase [Corynebacterium hylobatis]|uniref:Pyridine nucleotide-disulfide oxidoreductase n=1 Tax=Corynebacterium hylobatis TaxID=1859290 RepID=A0A430HWL0_9CORY|nr:FAD-dependent oxidoreductase [Corynebacterium hylobatis]RSZ61911.1 pyridine nucleotide-disulfide oxidoreductase [Corynebacterium hylobatis]